MLLTKEEVAQLARVKPRTVDAWVQRGELRAIKAGPRFNRFLLRDVEKFLGIAAGSLTLPAA
jgi:excisionase family DNA binding protein